MKSRFIIYILLGLNSCNHTDEGTFFKVLSNYGAEAKKDVPYNYDGILCRWKRTRERYLGLDSLDNGVRGLEIRINEEVFRDIGSVIILKGDDNHWNADLYLFRNLVEESGERALISKKLALGNPKSGWDILQKSLIRLDLLTLPDYSSIPNYDVSTDESYVTIEIAKGNYYRYYGYAGPYEWKKIPQVKKIIQIKELLKEEFSLEKYKPIREDLLK